MKAVHLNEVCFGRYGFLLHKLHISFEAQGPNFSKFLHFGKETEG